MELYVNIDVDDLDAGVAFYTRGLGLRLLRRLYDGRVAELLLPSGATAGTPAEASQGPSGVKVYLLRKAADSTAASGGQQRRDYGRHWTPVHLDLVVPDVDAAVARAREAGAVLEGEVHRSELRDIACMADPFGHGFCLLHFRVDPPYADGEKGKE